MEAAHQGVGIWTEPSAGIRWPWQGVDWSVGYVGFIFYFFCATTYALPLAREGMIVALMGVLFGSRDRLRPNAMWGLMLVYLVVAAAGFHGSVYASATWKPLEDLAKLVLITLVGLSVLTDRPRIRMFIFAYLGFYALYPVRGALMNAFWYHALESGRVQWNFIFANANDLSTLSLLPLSLCVGLLYVERVKAMRIAAMLGCILIPLVIFLAQSRGAIVSLAVGTLLLLASERRGRARALLILGGIAGTLAIFAPDSVWKRLRNLNTAATSGDFGAAEDQNSAEQRFDIARVAWAITKEHPLTGIGYGAYKEAHFAYAATGRFGPLVGGKRDAHNTYLTVMAETGFPGFIVWVTMVLVVAGAGVRALKRIRPVLPKVASQLKIILMCLLVVGLAAYFATVSSWSFTYLHLVLVAALTQQALRETAQALSRSDPRTAR